MKKKLIIIISIFLFMLLGIISLLLFSDGNFDLKSIIGNSTTSSKTRNVNMSDNFDSRLMYLYTADRSSRALQGSTYYNGKIYFATCNIYGNQNRDYETVLRTYDLNTKQFSIISYFDDAIPGSYKINDMATNKKAGRNYYALYNATTNDIRKGRILFSQNNYLRKADFPEDPYKITTISHYSGDTFISLATRKTLIKFNINADSNSNKASITDLKKYSIKGLEGDDITTQGIVTRGMTLYIAYQKSNINYLNVYYLKNMGLKQIEPVLTLNLGRTSERYEIESLFFIGKKLYIGFNNSSYGGISFYHLNKSNDKIVVNSSVTKNNDKKIYKITIKDGNKYGLAKYSFCTNNENDDCKYKRFTKTENNKKYYDLPYSTTVTKEIEINNNSSLYFYVYDILGNYKKIKLQ